MVVLVATRAASHIAACGEDHCTGSTGIEVYYWPPSQALCTKLIPWSKYNIENDIYVETGREKRGVGGVHTCMGFLVDRDVHH